ncbi:AAA family ATPase [Streptomyces caniscabiei]|uniref:AAA family ATPase n=1 Tax=Streptomyces caniscabiei TaxID=2746961 RepID=UPI0029B75381|nr:AAA family ATPase [Streptomyces caniscabiei]MDX2775988.1 AAA family ATPase [Streptomyces caniscabiei]
MKSLSLSQPHVIIMTGIPGSGKSFFAEKFAETFHAPYVCQTKVARLANIEEASATQVTLYQLQELFKTKQPIVFDGASETRAERAELTRLAKKAGYETLFVWIQTDAATAKGRSTKELKGKASPTLSSDEFDRRVKRFTPPNAIEKPMVVSGKHTYASQAKVVLKKLSAPRAASTQPIEPPVRPTSATSPRRNIVIR